MSSMSKRYKLASGRRTLIHNGAVCLPDREEGIKVVVTLTESRGAVERLRLQRWVLAGAGAYRTLVCEQLKDESD